MIHRPRCRQILIGLFSSGRVIAHIHFFSCATWLSHYSVRWQLLCIGEWMHPTIQIHYMEFKGGYSVKLRAASLHIYDALHACDTEQNTCATDIQGDWLGKSIVTRSNTHMHTHTFYWNTISRWCIAVISLSMQSAVNIKTNGVFLSDAKTFSQLLTPVLHIWGKPHIFIPCTIQKVAVFFFCNTTRKLHFHVKSTELLPHIFVLYCESIFIIIFFF